MVSSAIAGVDAWIQQAEEVLAEFREQRLSPSSVPHQKPQIVETSITFGDFAEGLEGVLKALCERPGRWILIAEDGRRPNRFWQALCYEDGSLYVEVVSNHYLEGDDRLTDEDERWLTARGWDVPRPPRFPNWSHVEDTTSPGVDEVAREAVEAMRAVFGVVDEGLLFTKLFPSNLRGDSPASPDPREEGFNEDDDRDVDEGAAQPPIRHYSRPDPGWTDAELKLWAGNFLSAILGRERPQGPDWCGRGVERVGGDAEIEGGEENPHPGPDASDDEIVRWAMLDLGITWDHQGGLIGWIDPDGGPDEEDPDLHSDPTADDPPFGDEEYEVEGDGDSA